MPEISPLGWLHTVLGAVAIISGAYTLIVNKEIRFDNRSGQLYLFATLITAATALGIFQRGTFGPGHALAIMTLLALAGGAIAAATPLFGRWARYVRATCFSGTLLFHSVPAITDGLLRLPVGDPVLTSIEDPVLKVCYLALLLMFLVGLGFQLRWIHRQG
jgi:uncharacterized membrane protein